MTAVEQSRRSAATRPPATANARALTAAAMQLPPQDVALARKVKLWRQDWQRYAWDFDETLSEIHYAHDYYGNVVSRVRLFAGFQVDPDDPPVPLDDLDDGDEAPEGSRPNVSAAAVEAMARLDAGADGGLGAIAGDLAVNLALAGEGYLLGQSDPDSATGESFAVYSVDELKPNDSGYALFPKGVTQGIPITDPDAFILRVWRRYRRFRDLADAPMRALLDDCDNLLMLKRVLYAATCSRMHGGIFLYPDDWTFPQRATDPNAQGQARDDPLTEQMMVAFTTPLQDPRSAGAVMPMLLKANSNSIDKARWLDLGRGYGEEILKQIADVRTGIAVGLDLPIEVLTGMGDVNHWGQWEIAEETFKSHIEPLVLVICRTLTDGYLWPLLRARGLDPTGYSVSFDASSLIGHPDLFANMQIMHAAYVVSDDALRRAGGASDDDAPDDDEIEKRLFIAQQQRVTVRETGIAPADVIQPPSDLALVPQPNDQPAPSNLTNPPATTPPNPAPPATKGPPPAGPKTVKAALVAAGQRSPLDQLGPRLTQIDQDLRARIQTLADAALQRALERAGAAIVRKQRSGRASSGKIDVKSFATLGQELGREHVLSMGLTEDKLIDGELGELEPEYRKLTKRALAAALLAGRRAVPDGGLSDEQVGTLTKDQDGYLAAGFAILSAAVLAAAHDQLFTPAQQPAGPGEIDLSARVSPSAIRESLAVAGGASGSPTAQGAPPGGVATGKIVMDAFRQALQVLPSGWQWVYGYPDKEFEPHANLEGVEFSSWEDDVLANDGDWPDVPFFRPGDHNGCSCGFIAMFASDRVDSEEPPEEG